MNIHSFLSFYISHSIPTKHIQKGYSVTFESSRGHHSRQVKLSSVPNLEFSNPILKSIPNTRLLSYFHFPTFNKISLLIPIHYRSNDKVENQSPIYTRMSKMSRRNPSFVFRNCNCSNVHEIPDSPRFRHFKSCKSFADFRVSKKETRKLNFRRSKPTVVRDKKRSVEIEMDLKRGRFGE